MYSVTSTQTLPRGPVLSKYHTVSQYTNKFNLIYAHNKSTAFPMPILMKLTNARWHLPTNIFNQITQHKWTVQMEIHLLLQVTYGFHYIYFHKTHNHSTDYCEHILYWILSNQTTNVESNSKV